MEVREVMHAPAVTCQPTTTLAEAARIMRDEDVGTLVVVGTHGEIVGIVTDRDMAVRGLADKLGPDTPVEAVMSKDVTTVHGYEDIFVAAGIMEQRHCRRLPVVDRAGHLDGVISLDDLMVVLTAQADKLAHAIGR